MAGSTFTTINDAAFMHSAIGALKIGLMPLNVFSISVGSDPMEKNETVTVPIVSAKAANTNATNYEDDDGSTVTGKVVNLTKNI